MESKSDLPADPEAKIPSILPNDVFDGTLLPPGRRRVSGKSCVPWRLSVDLPRALIFLCITGVGYLLMLAVMTMNVGYFCSVLGGAFLGDLAVGRYIQQVEHGH